jgi:hypothetical protein
MDFLQQIGGEFGLNLVDDPIRRSERGNLAYIGPDILTILPSRQGVYLVENKPYDNSILDGNQVAEGAYVLFVCRLRDLGIPCKYLVIHSRGCSTRLYGQVKAVQEKFAEREEWRDGFGVVLLEYLFREMGNCGFTYPPITEKWIDFSDTGGDVAEETARTA